MSNKVKIYYTNWKGETRMRIIIPISIHFTSTDWHKEIQWLLNAYDTEDSNKVKDFAMKDIHHWESING